MAANAARRSTGCGDFATELINGHASKVLGLGLGGAPT